MPTAAASAGHDQSVCTARSHDPRASSARGLGSQSWCSLSGRCWHGLSCTGCLGAPLRSPRRWSPQSYLLARLHHGVAGQVIAGEWVRGLIVGLASGLAVGLLYPLSEMVRAGTQVVGAGPLPSRFVHTGPDAVLVASRDSGLVAGSAVGLLVALPITLAFWLFDSMVAGFVAGLLAALLTSLLFGLPGGLDAWLCHHWWVWRLSRRGVIPRCLPEFLRWCAQPTQGWLRITNAYEFRHRELLDHLARAVSSSQGHRNNDPPRT